MAVHQNKNDLSVEATQECLDAAALLLTTEKQDGGIMGYAAALLLFCVADAIGHHLNYGSGDTRLDVLNHKSFGLGLSVDEIKQIKMWYRNPLSHNATVTPGVFITAEDDGSPFDFAQSPVTLRVHQFYKSVQAAWEPISSGAIPYDPLRHTIDRLTHLAKHPPFPGAVSAATPPSSGAIEP
jgi:hypothetical protein